MIDLCDIRWAEGIKDGSSRAFGRDLVGNVHGGGGRRCKDEAMLITDFNDSINQLWVLKASHKWGHEVVESVGVAHVYCGQSHASKGERGRGGKCTRLVRAVGELNKEFSVSLKDFLALGITGMLKKCVCDIDGWKKMSIRP